MMCDDFASNFVDYKIPVCKRSTISPLVYKQKSVKVQPVQSSAHKPITTFTHDYVYSNTSINNNNCSISDYILPSNNNIINDNFNSFFDKPSVCVFDSEVSIKQVKELRAKNEELREKINVLKHEVAIQSEYHNSYKHKVTEYYKSQEDQRITELRLSFQKYRNGLKSDINEKIADTNSKIEHIKHILHCYNNQLKETEEAYNTQHEHYSKVKEENVRLEDEKNAAIKTINQFSKSNTSLNTELSTINAKLSENNSVLQLLKYKFKQAKLDILAAQKLNQDQLSAQDNLLSQISNQNQQNMDMNAKLNSSQERCGTLENQFKNLQNKYTNLQNEVAKKYQEKKGLIDKKEKYLSKAEELQCQIKQYYAHAQKVNATSLFLRNNCCKLQNDIKTQANTIQQYQEFIIKESNQINNDFLNDQILINA